MAASSDLGNPNRCKSTPVLQNSVGLSEASGQSSFLGHTAFKISEHDEQYKELYSKVVHDLENAGQRLIQIEKVINPVQEEAFQLEIDHLRKTKQSKDYKLNITSLYHGTQGNMQQICDEGLDARLSRSGRFGKGIYFSDNPIKCCKYAARSNGPPFLLRCRVILGDIKEYPDGQHDRSNVREPVKEIVQGKRIYYDSVKGKPKDHTEYVIYDKRRAMIEYVIYYQSANSESSNGDGIHFSVAPSSTNRPSSPEGDSGDDLNRCSGSSDNGESGQDDAADSDAGGSSDNSNSNGVADAANATNSNKKVLPSRQRKGSSTLSNKALSPDNNPLSTIKSAPLLHSKTVLDQMKSGVEHLRLLKGTISATDMKELIDDFKKTYCRSGCPVDPSIAEALKQLMSDKDDPIQEVTESLAKHFSEVTGCKNMEECRRYIVNYSQLEDAIMAYFDEQ